MAKVEVTVLQNLQGNYGPDGSQGMAKAGDVVEMEEKHAKRLAKAGVVQMAGVENEGKLPNEGKSLLGKTTPPHMDSDKRINTDPAPKEKAPKATKK